MGKLQNWLNRNKRYKIVEENGINVLVETEASKSRRSNRREIINMLFTFISAVAAVVAAIFSALAYINS